MTQTPCTTHGRLRCAECAYTEELLDRIRKVESRADEAEAREQRLKEEVEYEIEICTLRGSDERAKELKELLTTLYPDTPRGDLQGAGDPDTPAPTLARHTCFHCEGEKTFVIPYEFGGPTIETCEICKGEGTLLYDEEQLKQLLPDAAPKEGDSK